MARAPKIVKNDRDLFLDELKDLSGKNYDLISNKTLRDKLGWDELRYKQTKTQLRAEGAINVGLGQGGKVGIPAPEPALPVFISYSHADESIKDKLESHISPIKRLGIIDAWTDRKIQAGQQWEQAINNAINGAKIIILLVSSDFIKSDYCYSNEMNRAIQMHNDGIARVIPVIVRACLWKHTPFAHLQAIPKDARAIMSWENEDEALADVAERLLEVAREMREE